MLKYKAEWYGVTLIEIRSFNPTTKRCHICGHINEELTFSDREWVCPNYGTEHDRDFNAAQNIKIIGLQSIKTPREPREEPVDQSALADGMKQETSSLVTE